MPPEGARDVVVAGGGLAGATLALAAARAGRRVLVLDRDPAPGHLPYPELLWGGTWRALDRLGAGEALRKEAVPLRGVEIGTPSGGGPLARVDAGDLARADAGAWVTRSSATRRALLRLAQEAGEVEVRSRTRVVGLLREGARVVGVRARSPEGLAEHRAAFVVGADGAGSVVRQEMGLGFPARVFPVEFLVRYVPRPPDLPEGAARAVIDPEGFRGDVIAAVLAPASGGEAGLVVFARPGAFEAWAARADPAGAFAEAARRVLGARAEEAARAFPGGFGHAERPVGHAAAYVRPGAALVGDAAHPVSPIGGQGANMAVLDAVALSEHALAPAPGRTPSVGALASYEAARRSANARGLRFSLRARRLFEAAWRLPALARPAPALLRALGGARPVRVAMLRRESRAHLPRGGHSPTRAR